MQFYHIVTYEQATGMGAVGIFCIPLSAKFVFEILVKTEQLPIQNTPPLDQNTDANSVISDTCLWVTVSQTIIDFN